MRTQLQSDIRHFSLTYFEADHAEALAMSLSDIAADYGYTEVAKFVRDFPQFGATKAQHIEALRINAGRVTINHNHNLTRNPNVNDSEHEAMFFESHGYFPLYI